MLTDLHEVDRREIFLKIVRMQDEGVGLDDSRNRVAAEFNIGPDDIRDIEAEGIKKMWPPLSDGES